MKPNVTEKTLNNEEEETKNIRSPRVCNLAEKWRTTLGLLTVNQLTGP